MSEKEIRVRIAPSPSGNLHVGTARTALFNYLFARHVGGKYILRIEDTDIERSNDEYTQNIFDSLKALGLDWDEGPDVGGPYGPYSQSERFDTYIEYAQKLLESGHAYECWCTQEELEAEKEQSIANKQAYIYSRKCLEITPEQIEQYKKEGRKPILRFKVPSKILKFNDMVKGELEFDTSLIGDFAIMKSNGTPTYNFAVVVDDILMKMTHIIRGEDHISNTPKQIFIYEALGAEVPKFAHAGMILAPDRSKLSKRHGATAVSEFVEQGYLPEALVNFVALLGWSPVDGVEIKSLKEIAEQFTVERISSSPTIFEFDKLNWMNGQYIRAMETKELIERLKPFMAQYDLSIYSESELVQLVDAVKEPLVLLSDITEAVSYFFGELVEVDEQVKTEVLDIPESQQVLAEFVKFAENISYGDVEKIHEELATFREMMKPLKPKQTMWAIRSALSGLTRGADMGVIVSLLGKDRVIARVKAALK